MPPRRKTDLRAAAARTEAPPPGSSGAIRTKPVRTTLDLDPGLWARVQARLLWLAQQTGRTKVPIVDAGRVLFELLADDEDLAGRVRDRLRSQ